MRKINWRIMRRGEISVNPEIMTEDERDLLLEDIVAHGSSSESDFSSILTKFSDTSSIFDALIGGDATPIDGVKWHYALQVKQGGLLRPHWSDLKTKQCHRAPIVNLHPPAKR